MKKSKRDTSISSPRTDGWARLVLACIVTLHLVLGLLYWHYTPYAVPPDEGAHGAYVRDLVVHHRLPRFTGYDPANYETHQPPLYYLLGVPFYLAAKSIGVMQPALGVRLLSLLLGTLAILISYSAARTAFPNDRRLALGAAGFVGLLPMHLVVSSAVSNDILAEVVFGLALLLSARMLVLGLSIRDTVLIGLVLGAGLLTKTTCVLLFPVVALVYLLVSQSGTGVRRAGGHFGIALGVSILVGGWWLVRNTLLYHDPLAISAFNEAFRGTTATPHDFLDRGLSWSTYLQLDLGWTFASFWGVFGSMKVFMPLTVYVLLAAITALAIVGCFPAVAELRRGLESARDVILIYGVTAALVILSFIRFNMTFFQAQGRYLYPALIPLSVFWILGFRRLFPSRVRDTAPGVAVLLVLGLAVYALVACIVPCLSYQIDPTLCSR